MTNRRNDTPHTFDKMCAPTLGDDHVCTVCGTYHGDPCMWCGRRAFHSPNCPVVGREEWSKWSTEEE